MLRRELIEYITETYNVEQDFPWLNTPEYSVFRHSNNKKWFAVLMHISKSRLGLQSEDMIDIVNVKCDPLLLGSLRQEAGFYPAYHMNKDNWLTIALDGTAPDDKIKLLLDISFTLTAAKLKKAKKPDSGC